MKFAYYISFSLAFALSFIGAILVIRFSGKFNLLDQPDGERRLHKHPTPTMGGLAVYGSFFLTTVVLGLLAGFLRHGNIPLSVLIGIWVGGGILMIAGFLDDRYRLPPKYSIIFPVLAALVIVFSNVHAVSVHNPFTGQILFLEQIKFLGLPFISGIIVFLWTMTMTYTTKLLDGMDGLVTGVAGIGALVIFGLSLTPQVMQPQTALLAITFAGSLFGFLILNFYPAKIFLGEGGSTLAGFMLAVLAIVSGGKIATTLLVLGIPLLDMLWVVLLRLMNKQSPFSGDRKHLHYKLIQIGFSEPQAVLFLYALTGIFGASALFLQSRGKFVAFIILTAVMLAIIASLYTVYKQGTKQND